MALALGMGLSSLGYGQGTQLYTEDFEGYAIGTYPTDWDSSAISPPDTDFVIDEIDNLRHYEATSDGPAVTSYLTITGSDTWQNYELRGDFRQHGGTTGFVALSNYPSTDRYVLLRRYSGDKLKVFTYGMNAPVETQQLTLPISNQIWFRIALRLEVVGADLHIRARAWDRDDPEPTSWTIDCTVPDAGQYAGTIGLWNQNGGTKRFDNLVVTALTDPEAPTNLVATTRSETRIDLYWDDNSSDETEFHLERSTDLLAWSVLPTVAANTTIYMDTGLTASTQYCYRVRAERPQPHGPTDYSNTDCATTDGSSPSPPSGLTATASTSTQVDLDWGDTSSNETGFEIERSTSGSGGPYSLLILLGVNSTTHADTTVSPSSEYCYRVRATGTASPSAYSNTECVTLLTAPTTLAATATSYAQIDLSWTDNSAETGFEVHRSSDGSGGPYTLLANLGASVTAHFDTTVLANSEYCYRVRATGPSATSDFSNAACDTTPPPPSGGGLPYSEDFESYAIGSVPTDWTSHSTFEIDEIDGFRHYKTITAAGNISYLTVSGSDTWQNYELRGDFRQNGGASGFVALSNHPSTDRYVLLRRYSGDKLKIFTYAMNSPVGTTQLTLPISSQIWFSVALQLEVDGADLHIRARAWDRDDPEPTSWTIDCTVADAGQYTGTIGLWGENGGIKRFDNLLVTSLSSGPPSNLIAIPNSSTEIGLTWADNSSDETDFEIERSDTGAGGSYSLIATLGPNVTSHNDPGRTPDDEYCYRVRALTGAGPSAYSAPACATPTTNPPLLPSPIASYPFDEGSGTAILDVAGNNDGVLENGASRNTNGKYGEAIEFDGVSGNIDLGGLDVTGTALTISGWFKADDFGIGDARIISKAVGTADDDHYWMVSTLKQSGITKLRFRLKTNDGNLTSTLVADTVTLAAGVWTHFAATYDGVDMAIYQDGALVGSTLKSGALRTDPAVQAWIGDNPVGSRVFDGLIDNIRIYDAALTVAEVTDDMNTPADQPPLVAPTDLTTSPRSSTELDLLWLDNSENEDGFEIERSVSGPTGPFMLLASVGPNTGLYTDTLSCGELCYRVRAVTATSTSSYSNVACDGDPDTTPPEFMIAWIEKETLTSSFKVYQAFGATSAISDEQWPVTAKLYSLSNPAIYDTQTISGTNDLSLDVEITGVATGQRAVLEAIDDCGNRSELHFIIGQSTQSAVSYDSIFGAFNESPTQANAERTGFAPIAGHGVLLLGREFTTSRSIHFIKGAVLDSVIQLSYRSGIGFDGPVGDSWDWNLDARVELDTVPNPDEYWWYPGDGRKEGPFTVNDSPAGIFLRLSLANGEVFLEDAAGFKFVFDSSSGLLKRMLDSQSSPNVVTIERNTSDQIIKLIDDLGRVTRFQWHYSGHLAAVEDFGGRRTFLDYDTNGNLVRVLRPDETPAPVVLANQDFVYGVGTSSLTEIRDGNGRAILKNHYNQGKIEQQRNRHNLDETTTQPIVFTPDDPLNPTFVTVADALGGLTKYHFETAPPHALAQIEWLTKAEDRNNNPAYPGVDDPGWGHRLMIFLHPSTLLLSEQYYELSSDGINWGVRREWEKWTYLSPTDPDPLLRFRAIRHGLWDPDSNPPTERFFESWDYPTGAEKFPSSHTSFQGVQTMYSYHETTQQFITDQISETQVANVTTPIETYNIVSKSEYDSRGRLEKEWSPNRATSSQPSTVYEYYDSSAGVQEGYLKKVITQNADGTETGSWTEFEYDVYGRTTTRRKARDGNATPQFNSWNMVYDDRDRLVQQIGPSVTLTYPQATNDPFEQIDYVYSGDDLELVTRKHFDENGNAGSGSGGLNPPSIVLADYDYDNEGRVRAVRQDLKSDGSSIDQSETLYFFDDRGNIERISRKATTNKSIDTVRVYDAHRILLRETVYPDGVNGEDTWYRYDHAGRVLERYPWQGGNSSSPWVTEFDVFGRISRESSPQTAMDYQSAVGGPETLGFFETEYVYDNGAPTFALQRMKKLYHEGASSTQLTEETYSYDSAGRRYETKTWYDGTDTNKTYSVKTTALYPDGQTKRSYLPRNLGMSIPNSYTQTTLDDFDRVDFVEQKDNGTTITKTDFDYQGNTGLLEFEWRSHYDESNGGMEFRHKTEFVYDTLGRETQRVEYGKTTASEEIRAYIHYDGMGRVYETQKKDDAGVGGVITRNTYDFAGRIASRLTGKAFGPSDLFQSEIWRYDLLSRTLEEMTKNEMDGTERGFVFTYDDIGRPLTRTLLKRQNGADLSPETTTYTYGYGNGLATTTVTDPRTIGITTHRNQLGHKLFEAVDWNNQTPPTGAASAVRYIYAGGTGCGCIAAGKPAEVQTVDDQTQQLTKVVRTYSPRGETLTETISVGAGPDSVMTSTFSYDAVGRKVEIGYPNPPDDLDPPTQTFEGGAISRDFRSDGRIRELKLWDQESGASHRIGHYQYAGSTETSRTLYQAWNGAEASVATVTTTLDDLGRLASKTMTFADGTADVVDAVSGRNVDGLITLRTEPRDPANSPNPTGQSTYDGPNWLVGVTWRENTDGHAEQDYDRDGYGVVEHVYERRYFTANCNPPMPTVSQDWPVDSDDLGRIAFAGTQGVQFDQDHPGVGYITHKRTNRSFTPDAAGNPLFTSERYEEDFDCAPCGGQPTPYDKTVRDFSWTYTTDAWGRQIQAAYSSTYDLTLSEQFDVECNPGPFSGPNTSRFYTYRYDGFGRVVYSTVPRGGSVFSEMVPLFHAYDGHARIASHETGDTMEPEFAEYYYNPSTGRVDKYRIQIEGSYFGTYGTNVYDIYGNAIMSSASTDGVSYAFNNEGNFNPNPRLYLATGDRVQVEGIADDEPSFGGYFAFVEQEQRDEGLDQPNVFVKDDDPHAIPEDVALAIVVYPSRPSNRGAPRGEGSRGGNIGFELHAERRGKLLVKQGWADGGWDYRGPTNVLLEQAPWAINGFNTRQHTPPGRENAEVARDIVTRIANSEENKDKKISNIEVIGHRAKKKRVTVGGGFLGGDTPPGSAILGNESVVALLALKGAKRFTNPCQIQITACYVPKSLAELIAWASGCSVTSHPHLVFIGGSCDVIYEDRSKRTKDKQGNFLFFGGGTPTVTPPPGN